MWEKVAVAEVKEAIWVYKDQWAEEAETARKAQIAISKAKGCNGDGDGA